MTERGGLDEEIRRLEKLAQDDPGARAALIAAKERAGRWVWVLKYGEDSVGLDGAIIGIYTSRDRAVKTVAERDKNFHPGRKGDWRDWHNPRTSEDGVWTDGYRNICIQEIELDTRQF